MFPFSFTPNIILHHFLSWGFSHVPTRPPAAGRPRMEKRSPKYRWPAQPSWPTFAAVKIISFGCPLCLFSSPSQEVPASKFQFTQFPSLLRRDICLKPQKELRFPIEIKKKKIQSSEIKNYARALNYAALFLFTCRAVLTATRVI